MVRRLVQLYVGLGLYGLSTAMFIRSDLGVDPWDVFHLGVAIQTGMSIGTVIILTGAAVLLLWIPEDPTRRFLFNISAWAFGAFLLGLNVLTTIAARNWAALLALALSLVFVAMVARRVGLLADYSWIPGRRSARPVGRTHARSSARTTRSTRRAASDEDRMDELLGKISANGLHSLSKSERKELDKLRLRRKQGR